MLNMNLAQSSANSPSLLSVVLTGLVIVFALLLFFVLVFSLFGLFSKANKKGKNMPSKPAAVRKPVPKPAAPAAMTENDDEIIAVISAAVYAMYENTGIRPVIRSVKPAKTSGRSAWANAGILNNVKSF